MSKFKEAQITINGVLLTMGQSMALRVAIESFRMDMVPGHLGTDEHGEFMQKAYPARAAEISTLIRHHTWKVKQ